MRAGWWLLRRDGSMLLALLMWLSAVSVPGLVQAETCVLTSQHAGVTFPVEKVDPVWTCRLHAIIGTYTTVNKVGPIRAALSESMYQYLLDRPPLAGALINRLDLGLYEAERRGPGRYWGNDGEGTEGIVELVYQDRTSRIYYLVGSHHSRLLPNMTGKAVVLVSMNAVKEASGAEAMDSTMVSYARLDSRILSGLMSLLRPLIGGIVSRKLAKGVEAVNRLGLEMRERPERVLFEATDPPSLPAEDVAFLKVAIGSQQIPHLSGQTKTTKP
jgi:hypothetical protein